MEKDIAKKKKPLWRRIRNFFYEKDRKVFGSRHLAAGPVLSKRRTSLFIVALLFIPIAHWLVFWLYININSIFLAFQDFRTGEATFVNFQLFWEKLTSPVGNEIGIALRNTLIYFGTTVLVTMPLSFVIAYFLYKKILGHRIFRIIFYLPAIISGVALVAAFKEMVAPYGFISKILEFFGMEIPEGGLLYDNTTATGTIVVYCILTGFTTNVLLFSGAMARVPQEVLESARLEGCGSFRELVEIIFPLIWPTFATQLIFTMTGLFTASGPIMLFDKMNNYETITISYWIYREIYGTGLGGTGNYNLVSATGLVFTLIGFPIIMLTRFLTDKVEPVEY
ncbi:MAG: sugar ABC transporter permease [Bacilli bacterium]|nr:sugar ABC transporter permease [Bacilli bacterium]